MPRITFVDYQGVVRTVEAPEGWTVRDAAINNSVPGIVSECGGVCACATCHVYVDAQWVTKLQPPEDTERGLLEFANGPRPESRLSCQIEITKELDGLVVSTPETQG